MYRVLVIDDEEDVLTAILRRLTREGYDATGAANSAEGIELIQKNEMPFDVVITDMSMEDSQSGLRVLSAAFARDLFAEVLVMTAFGNVANAVECMRRGAFDYIEKNKPGSDVYEVIVDKIEEAMDRRRQDVRAIERWEWAARAQEKRHHDHP